MSLENMFPHFYESIEGAFDFHDVYHNAIESVSCDVKSMFVEVGCYFGRSAAYMAVEIKRSLKPVQFFCVDTFLGSDNEPAQLEIIRSYGGSLQNKFMSTMKEGLVLFNPLIPIVMSSVEAATMFTDKSLSFVFIDANHSYQNVKNDILAWMPKLKDSGIIAGHDYAPDCQGVVKAVDELIGQFLISGRSWIKDVAKTS